MIKEKLSKMIVPVISVIALLLVGYAVYALQNGDYIEMSDSANNYVTKTIFGNLYPVVGETEVILRPYKDEGVSIIRNFYNYKGEIEDQTNSLVIYENTYIQNSGIDYGKTEAFDVISVMPGTVISVKDDNLLGKIIEIKHSNDLIGIYQSLSETIVQKDDEILAGDTLGKSGNSNISKDLGNHLHFELYYKGQVVNPEDFFGKNIKDL